MHRILACFVLVFAAWPARGDAPAPASGVLWEITSSAEMPGVPTAAPRVTRTCTASSTEPPPPDTGGKSECTITESTVSGATRTWKMTCGADVEIVGRTSMKGADAWEAESRMTMAGRSIRTVMTGKRVGTCDYTPPKVPAAAAKQK